ncbi:hypothetical protein F5148DRAFT_563176 [Russula earlei]|uniref:Uncharacterized protein n=1 Tax=Russula earlei TaxID=71964 RepID=A0ACC0UMT9_9AGAM|nr:hypothetical protein F5148DRAFT_563176 [Russula earlei]
MPRSNARRHMNTAPPRPTLTTFSSTLRSQTHPSTPLCKPIRSNSTQIRLLLLCLLLPMFPTTSASTHRVLKVTLSHNPHRQTTFLPSLRQYSPQNHRKRKGEYAESQIVVSVVATTRKIRLASRRRWSPAMSVVVVAIQLAWILAPLLTLCVPIPGSASNVRYAKFVKKRETMLGFFSVILVTEVGIWIA